MSKKLYFLICFVSVVTLTSAGYTSELVGNFEQDLDGWEPQNNPPITPEMMTRSPKGATLSDYSLRLDVPEGAFIWAIRRPLHTETHKVTNNNRVAFDVTWIESEWIARGSTWGKIDKLAFNGEGINWSEFSDLVSGTIDFSVGAGDFTSRLVWDYSDIDFSSMPAEPYELYLAIPINSDNGGPVYFDNIVFFDSAFANEPIPANPQTQVDLDTNLEWTPGDTVIAHDIYFGTSFTEVDEADNSGAPGPTEIYRANQNIGNEEYIIPETLDIGTTYYWRVDENNSVELLKGEVWSFTTKVAEARSPYPADGAINVPHTVVLNWTPGVSVQDVNGHEVYFGTDFTEVDDATKLSSVYQGAPDVSYYDVSTIVNWDETYFWRIDEVNGPTTWKGPVWSFRLIGAIASNPSPASPSADVSPFVTLTWTPGGEADSHQVYISADFSQVDLRDANVMTPETSNTHEPGPLDFDTTYYWAVDEVNLAADVTTWYGDIWQFSTTTNLVVDDMESYDAINEIFDTWLDGEPLNNGSWLYLETIIANDDDGNSLRFEYDNTLKLSGNVYGSWTDAAIADLQIGTDWTLAGTKALRLYFYGDDPTNSTTANDKMYVALDDGTTAHSAYYHDVNDINEPSWHEWQIDLEDFNSAGVVLENISKISIGFGTYGGSLASGGYGTVYFDDIELWPPLCRPEMVTGDFDSDCDIDGYDLEIMSNDWLQTDVNLTLSVSPPNEPVLWYSFEEAEGTVAGDQMGDFNGTVINLGDDTWDTAGGRDGSGCINLAAGSGTYVSIPPESLNFAGTTNKITVAAWVNGDRFNSQSWGSLFCVRATGGDPPEDGDEVVEVHCPTPIPPDFEYGPIVEWRVAGSAFCESGTMNLMDFAGRWNHYAFTKDADADTMSIYHNGQLIVEVVDVNSALDPMFDTPVELFYIGARHVYWGYHIGRIDDFQVYDYDLSPEEVAYLATDGTGSLFIPLETPTNVYDVAPNIVNFRDFSVFAENWLKEQLWPLP